MNILIKDPFIVNEGQIFKSDILIKGKRIVKISKKIPVNEEVKIINARGKYLIPGIIDDQVHFRQPGLTHKADIYNESKAAVSGGITSYMEMPNTIPQTLTQELLEQKFEIAKKDSFANFTFFMGVSNNNIEEVLKTDPKNVGALKIFMGSSTGKMLVDDRKVLDRIFKESNMLIAVHCEDETLIKKNIKIFKEKYGELVPIEEHPNIRSAEACYKSSSYAVELAKKHNTRLHVFHISTSKELELFDNSVPLSEKKITSEVCIHHLWFSNKDYNKKGNFIKWNPSVKTENDRTELFKALLDDRIDVIATDHAPHTLEEKNQSYFKSPSGGPLVQHSLNVMIEFYKQGKISLEKIVEKMCHNPSILFNVKERGFVRERYFADLVILDLNKIWTVKKENILSKCGWSPFEGDTFSSKITHTFVNGYLSYENGIFHELNRGMRLEFDR
tara:strand:+ start:64950 stop:66284 length:1335 start_codon:yes stop_codon:yes gene_type:complete